MILKTNSHNFVVGYITEKKMLSDWIVAMGMSGIYRMHVHTSHTKF